MSAHSGATAIACLLTARDWIRWGASRFNEAGLFFGHGCDNAVDEAAALVAHALHLAPQIDNGLLDGRLLDGEKEAIASLIDARIERHCPAPYLTGEAWFAGLPFTVDERVIVPRSPMAELIAEQFGRWFDEPPGRVLDLCCGSGCIAIATAWALPGAEVDAVDLSPDALEVARINIDRHDLEGRVIAIESDLFDSLGQERYDLIVSNPPYVADSERQTLPDEYLCEPEMALFAGEEGLDLVDRILAGAAAHLTDSGVLIVEVGASAEALCRHYPQLAFEWIEFMHGGEGVFALRREQLLLAGLIA